MDGARDSRILALLIVVVTCLTMYFLGYVSPAGAVVDYLFPRL